MKPLRENRNHVWFRNRFNAKQWMLLTAILAVWLVGSGYSKGGQAGAKTYTTWGGFLEVDKCASAWVIERFVCGEEQMKRKKEKGKSGNGQEEGQGSKVVGDERTEGPVFKFFPPGTVIREGIQFDTTGARKYARQPGKAIMETIIWVHKLEDPALLRLTKVVRDIEINKWGEKMTPEAVGLEAIVNGLNRISKDEHECLERSFVVFDALYAEFRGKSK